MNAGSLRHALREQSLSLDQESTLDVLKAYDDLETFPDVPSVLSSLSEQPNIIPFIFSNGTQSMVESSVHRSKSLAPYSKAFKDIITVDEVKKYKPAQEVYRYLRERVEKCLPYLKSSGGPYMEMDQMWLVSGNPFDVVGANVAGMKSAWVDRLGNGWCDSLVDKLPGFMDTRLGVPDVTARSLGEALDHIKKDMK